MHEQRGRLVEPSQLGAVGIAGKGGERLEPRAPEVGIGPTQAQRRLGASDHGGSRVLSDCDKPAAWR